jgi:hypothetical protein
MTIPKVKIETWRDIPGLPAGWDVVERSNGQSFDVVYNYYSSRSMLFNIDRPNYTNSSKRIDMYEWSLPDGWVGTDGKTGTFLHGHVLGVIPDKCTGGQVKFRPVDAYCGNQNAREDQDLKGNWTVININRTGIPTITMTSSTDNVPWGEPTPITFTVTNTNTNNVTPDRYEWTIVSGFEGGARTETTVSYTLPLTHEGLVTGMVSVRAVLCGYNSNTVTRQISVHSVPSISGPDIICTEDVYTLNSPNYEVEWSSEPEDGFIITFLDALSNSVRVEADITNPDARFTILKASVNGNTVAEKPIFVCLSIDGPDAIENLNERATYEIINLPKEVSVKWEYSNNLIDVFSPMIKGPGIPIPDDPIIIVNPPHTITLQVNTNIPPLLSGRAWLKATLQPFGIPIPHNPKEIRVPRPIAEPGIVIIFSPNPTNDKLTIDFISEQTDEHENTSTETVDNSEITYSVKLFDNSGVVQRQTRHRHRRRGNHQGRSFVEFNVSNLREGTYYLHIEHNEEMERHQIIITR